MKRGFEANFTWLFVLFVGAAILSGAAYMAVKLVRTSEIGANAAASAELGTLLTPLETGIESSAYYRITFPERVAVDTKCDEAGTYGLQKLNVVLAKNKAAQSIAYSTVHKYVFSNAKLEGTYIDALVMSFSFPYKVADIMMLYTGAYCFVNPPENVKDELVLLDLPSVNVTASKGNCPSASTTVCFGGSGCSITVLPETNLRGIVKKQGVSMEYYGPLMYGAVFADSATYNCQVSRLLKRAALLAELYQEKAAVVQAEGCGFSASASLDVFAASLHEPGANTHIHTLSLLAESMEVSNDRLTCPLF